MQEISELFHQCFTRTKVALSTAVEDVVYQCCLEQGEDYHLVIANNILEVAPGTHAAPTLRLYFTNEQVPKLIAKGELDPMQAFLDEQFRADGHLLLVMQYLMLFGPLSPVADLR